MTREMERKILPSSSQLNLVNHWRTHPLNKGHLEERQRCSLFRSVSYLEVILMWAVLSVHYREVSFI